MKGTVFTKNDEYGLVAWFVEYEGEHFKIVDMIGHVSTRPMGDDGQHLYTGRDENKPVEFSLVEKRQGRDCAGTCYFNRLLW